MNIPSTDTHRINVWTQCKSIITVLCCPQPSKHLKADGLLASVKIPNLDPSAGLDCHGNLFGRVAGSGKIQSWNITYQAENSTIGSTMLSEVGGPPGIPGTRVVAVSPPELPSSVFVFYQANVNEIVMSAGNKVTGRWNSTTLPVPDS